MRNAGCLIGVNGRDGHIVGPRLRQEAEPEVLAVVGVLHDPDHVDLGRRALHLEPVAPHLRYRGSSKTPPPVGPYSSPMPRDLLWSYGGGCLL